AEIRFVDDTVLTVAPESRVAIDEYIYDAAKSKRQATVEVFRGMVHFLVTKILQAEPDFIMKTHTGVLGVRGTGWYAQLTALHTDIYNEQGTTEVRNIFPEVPGKVTLTGMQFTRVGFNLPPTLPLPITQQDLQQLRIQFSTSPSSGGGTAAGGLGTVSPLEIMAQGANPVTGPYGGTVPATAFSTQNNLVNDPISNPAIAIFTQNPLLNNPANNPLITPPPTPGPISSTYAFLMTLSGYSTFSSVDPTYGYSAIVNASGWGQLTGVYPTYFTLSASGSDTSANQISNVTRTWAETFSGSVSGTLGQTLTGTFTATGTNSTGGTLSSASGTISIAPNGSATWSDSGTWTGANGNTTYATRSGTSTPGNYFSETAVGSLAMTSNPSGNQQTITNNSDLTNGTYLIWGTRTGVSPGTFSATLNMTETAPAGVTGYYPPADQGSLTATMQGVVSGSAGGTQTGVMTTIAGGQGTNSTSYTLAGPVTIDQYGNLSATFYGTNTNNTVSPAPAGIFTQQGYWTQTAQAIPAASTYSFSIPLTESDYINPTSTTQASVESSGFGTRTGIYPGTYLSNVDNGTLTGGSFTVGNASSTTVSGTLSGSVTGVLGGYTLGDGTLAGGSGTFTGTNAAGQSISYTGPITITPSGKLIFNYTGTVGALTAAGTMTEQFGIAVSESSSGTYSVVSGGSNPTLLNTSQMNGSQTIGSASPVNTYGSLALTWGNGFSGLPTTLTTGGSGTMSLNGSGAVSPWYGGQPTYGVLGSTVAVTVTGDAAAPSPQSVMQVTYYPTNSNLIGQLAIGGGSGSFLNAVLATTPTSSTLTTRSFAESFSGSYQLTSNFPYSTASITNSGLLSGTMYLGGSGAVVSYPSEGNQLTGSFNLIGASQAGAFSPGSASGSVSVNNMIGAVAGPTNGTLTGLALGSWSASYSSTMFGSGFSGLFSINTDPSLPAGSSLPATLTLSQGNVGFTPNGYPMTLTGTWNQVDPPLTGTTAGTGTATWANAPFLSTRFTQLTGTSLGSRIQGAAQLTQFGTPGNPALAANLRAAWRFRQLQRLAALRAASGATVGGRTLANPAGAILALRRH
ncbi:MAG: FecR domain-containing protein, partial [Desulfobaccales bacterium]